MLFSNINLVFPNCLQTRYKVSIFNLDDHIGWKGDHICQCNTHSFYKDFKRATCIFVMKQIIIKRLVYWYLKPLRCIIHWTADQIALSNKEEPNQVNHIAMLMCITNYQFQWNKIHWPFQYQLISTRVSVAYIVY